MSTNSSIESAKANWPVLIVGTGSIGRRHIASLQNLLVTPSWIFLRRQASPDALSDSLHARIETDITAALAHKPRMAVIASPSSEHAGVLITLLQAGIPVYIEKPVVTRPDECAQLQTLLATIPSLTQVGCNLRFLPSLQHLKRQITQGLIGRVIRADFQAGQWLPDWRPQQDYRQSYSADPALGGGVLFDLIHEIDAARWLLGDFVQATGFSAHASALEIQSDDVAALVLRQSTGLLATVGLDYVARRPLRRYTIIGEDGTLVWDLPARRLWHFTADYTHQFPLENQDFDVKATYPAAMQSFISAILTQQPSEQPLAEGIAALQLLFQVQHV